VLQSRGYHCFSLTTSNVHYDHKGNGSFTLFALINSPLFPLDVTMAASNYVSALRYHVVPKWMTIADLLSLSTLANMVTMLVSGQDIVVEQRRSRRSLIMVGGVDIVVPGMFYRRDIAVHSLEGKNKGLIAKTYDWDEEEVSSNDKEVIEVKALMALADEERVFVGKKVSEMVNGLKSL
nr:fasciclin-like arabinogalactan protein 19 [Tanacetum cinerariifolium]